MAAEGPFVLSAGEFAPNAALGAPVWQQLLVLAAIGFVGFMTLWLLQLTTIKETGTVLTRILLAVAVSYVLMVYTDELWPG
mmetsp:Transcript_32745/g.61490  ORF Transcript_32745/g.61490 Transcript_32745/m.61490 type:complete len:81 (-) Transcript_32745:13-255(-)